MMLSMMRTIRLLIGISLLLGIAGCGSLRVDKTSYQSQYFDSRVSWIVLHYTSADFDRSIELLTRTPVSSHYLISDSPVRIYQLVDENQRAWHAGDSAWMGRRWLNASSIGVELVHPGVKQDGDKLAWVEWDEAQIDALMLLLDDIITRHELPINSVIGHSDIAPSRKLDPGPAFPWQRLAEAGMIHWPIESDVLVRTADYEAQLPDAAWFQDQLKILGYELARTEQFDQTTKDVLQAVQMKYRPALFTGEPDAETAAILWSLVQQKQTQES